MKILFVTQHYLSGVGGGTFATRAYINAFAECSDQMSLLYLTKQGQSIFPEINPKIELVPVSNEIAKWKKALNILIGKTHRFGNIVPKLLNKYRYDIVVFDNSKTSLGLIDVAHQYGSKVIVINHNFEYEYVRDNSNSFFRPFVLNTIKRVEKDAAQKADLNLTLSNQDTKLLCEAFRSGNQENFRLLGTFEYANTHRKVFEKDNTNGNNFVITGNLSAQQTEQSLLPWLQDYYPIFREIYPNATLTIAGKNPSVSIQTICDKLHVNLIPSPESMDPIMKQADFYICPTCLGGGIKLRVMDGLKWGLPVITHAVSARGYDLFVQKGCMFEYIDKESFRQSLIKLRSYSFDKRSVYEDYLSIFSFNAGVERVRKIIIELSNRYE